MDLKLQSRTALVTGSTAGIGLAIAKRLAAEGANVLIVGRERGKVDAAVDEIKTFGGKARGIVADAGTAEGADAIVAAAGSVDILVNNLGIYESKPFAEITDADWLRFFEINVLSGVRLARAYFPKMLERNSGRIIFVSSESAINIPSDMIHYGMTKTAQLSVARGLAELTKGTKVTVNSVLPGPTRAAGIEAFLRSRSARPDAPMAELEAEFFAEARASSLLQRMIEPEEIADLVAFVASPLSAATNGAALRVEGGLLTDVG